MAELFFILYCSYHFCQEGAACINHEGMRIEDLATVHLELPVTQLRVVHHAAQIWCQGGQRPLQRKQGSRCLSERTRAFILWFPNFGLETLKRYLTDKWLPLSSLAPGWHKVLPAWLWRSSASVCVIAGGPPLTHRSVVSSRKKPLTWRSVDKLVFLSVGRSLKTIS